MDWTQVGVAGVAGGLSALLGSLIGALVDRALKPESAGWRAGRWLPIAFAIVGAQVAGAVFSSYQSSPSRVEAEMLSDERIGALASAWRDAEPETFSRFIDGVSRALREGQSRDEAVNDLRVGLLGAATGRVRYLDDASAVETARIARDEYAELATSRPQICHPMFNGGAFGDVTPYLSEPLLRRELDVLTEAFRADTSIERRTLTGAELEIAIRQALDGVRHNVGDDVGLLAPSASLVGREAQYCRAVASFFASVAAMPESEAAALMRGLRTLQ